MRGGLIGGHLGYLLLRALGGNSQGVHCSGAPYRDRSKLEVLLGPGIWDELAGKTVIDFGCGEGVEAVEIAARGARKVIGIDIRTHLLAQAAQRAKQVGVEQRCEFVTETTEAADRILSIDAFEHYADPAGVLRIMERLLKSDGVALIAFGPPWLHPYGGHLFSVFPWAHLVFTEAALIRWRSDFKDDGARRFSEVAGGLNQMTLHRFRRLVDQSEFEIEDLEAVPIRRLRPLFNALTREIFTSVVRCRLIRRTSVERSRVS